MPYSRDVKSFAFISLVAFVAVALLLRFGFVEDLSYRVEKGRLRALRETLPATDSYGTGRWVAEFVRPAVVSLEVEFARPPQGPGARGETEPVVEPGPSGPDGSDGALDLETAAAIEQGLGSGFIFDHERGYVLTNAHVVDGASVVRVSLADGRQVVAQVLGLDPDSDLAVLKIDAVGLHALNLASGEPVAVGDEVYVVGSPFGLEGSVTKGIVSAVGRRVVTDSGTYYPAMLQTDAVIRPGNSGGPLVNRRGEVVGVTTAIVTGGTTYDGLGFAIPASRVREMMADLIDGGPGVLGVWVGSVSDSDWQSEVRALAWEKAFGALITDVIPGGGAAKADLRVNDIILSVGGERIDDIESLGLAVSGRTPGTVVEVTVWRDGVSLSRDVLVTRRYAPRLVSP